MSRDSNGSSSVSNSPGEGGDMGGLSERGRKESKREDRELEKVATSERGKGRNEPRAFPKVEVRCRFRREQCDPLRKREILQCQHRTREEGKMK